MQKTTVYLDQMDNQSLVDYLNEQMRVGHDEPTLRKHLEGSGWSAEAIDDAFVKQHRANASELKAARAARRKNRRRQWTLIKRVKLGVSLAVIAVLLSIGGNSFLKKNHSLPLVAAKPLTYAQKQANDVNMIAGAVAQYAADMNGLPTVIGASQDNSVNICGAGCSADSAVVVTTAYKPTGVKFAPYSPGLTAPDKNTMYLVAGAKCASRTSIGTVNTKPRSMVILYAETTDDGLLQHCVVL